MFDKCNHSCCHHLILFVWHARICFYLKRERHSFLFIIQFLCRALSKLSIVSFLHPFSAILSVLIKTTRDSAGNPVGLLTVSWSHPFFPCFCLLNPVLLVNPSLASHWIPNFPLSAPVFGANCAPLHFPYPMLYPFLPPLSVRPSRVSLRHPAVRKALPAVSAAHSPARPKHYRLRRQRPAEEVFHGWFFLLFTRFLVPEVCAWITVDFCHRKLWATAATLLGQKTKGSPNPLWALLVARP